MTETLERLEKRDWELLLEPIKDQKCTPILGAGFRSDGSSMRKNIVQNWAEKYDYPLDDNVDLASFARFLAVDYDAGYPKKRLVEQLQTFQPPNFDDENDPYMILASLPLPVYITTNYDDYMFQALLKNKFRQPKREVCRWNENLKEPESVFEDGWQPTPANPVVFHFNGHADNLDSLVLTEDDYFEFLINVSKDRTLIPHIIERAMSKSSLLMLGYRLDDWDFRVLFNLLAAYLKISMSTTHMAVQIAPVGDTAPEEQRKKAQTYLDHYFGRYKRLNIRIYWGTCQEFMADLKQRL